MRTWKLLCGRRAEGSVRPSFPTLASSLQSCALNPDLTRNLKYSDIAFSGQNEGTISVVEGETLYVIEEDKGDGWTRIRRSEDEEGYVPTSYVEVYLDKNAKGAKTYI